MLAALTATPLDAGTAHFQPSTLQVTTIDVGNPAANVIPAEAARQLQHPLQRRAHRGEPGNGSAAAPATAVGGELRPARRMLRRVLPDAARPFSELVATPSSAVTGLHAGAQHHRRHLRRALHQGSLPGRRVRPGRPDHAQGRRACRARRHRAADRDLSAHSRQRISTADAKPAEIPSSVCRACSGWHCFDLDIPALLRPVDGEERCARSAAAPLLLPVYVLADAGCRSIARCRARWRS